MVGVWCSVVVTVLVVSRRNNIKETARLRYRLLTVFAVASCCSWCYLWIYTCTYYNVIYNILYVICTYVYAYLSL